jgi:predicted nucleic acid-binding protein
MTNVVVVDSDSIFALYNPNDPLNEKATQTFQRLIALGYQLVYPTSVIFEVISLFQRVLPTPTVTTKRLFAKSEASV